MLLKLEWVHWNQDKTEDDGETPSSVLTVQFQVWSTKPWLICLIRLSVVPVKQIEHSTALSHSSIPTLIKTSPSLQMWDPKQLRSGWNKFLLELCQKQNKNIFIKRWDFYIFYILYMCMNGQIEKIQLLPLLLN